MKELTFKLKPSAAMVGLAVMAVLAAPLYLSDTNSTGDGYLGLFPVAYAAEEGGQGHRGAGGPGEQGHKGAGGPGGQGGKKGIDRVLEADDDSDRPPWAQGNRDENPHAQGGGQPPDAGDKKGDEYGDLIVLLRNPVTGEPVLDDAGQLQVCTVPDCTSYVSMIDGEIPPGVTPIEVEFGRAAVARSPDKVIDKALTDAITKLTAEGVELGTDEAGRITYTVDGVTSTIDSPLENLALYVDLVTGLASDTTSDAETALGDLATLNTAAALFAGVADKTGDISLDYVVYQNVIADVVEQGDYYDFSSLTYARDYPDNYTYWLSIDGADPVAKVLDVDAYLEAINGSLPADDGAVLFSAAADDALEVIELIHTQVHTEVLPGTVVSP